MLKLSKINNDYKEEVKPFIVDIYHGEDDDGFYNRYREDILQYCNELAQLVLLNNVWGMSIQTNFILKGEKLFTFKYNYKTKRAFTVLSNRLMMVKSYDNEKQVKEMKTPKPSKEEIRSIAAFNQEVLNLRLKNRFSMFSKVAKEYKVPFDHFKRLNSKIIDRKELFHHVEPKIKYMNVKNFYKTEKVIRYNVLLKCVVKLIKKLRRSRRMIIYRKEEYENEIKKEERRRLNFAGSGVFPFKAPEHIETQMISLKKKGLIKEGDLVSYRLIHGKYRYTINGVTIQEDASRVYRVGPRKALRMKQVKELVMINKEAIIETAKHTKQFPRAKYPLDIYRFSKFLTSILKACNDFYISLLKGSKDMNLLIKACWKSTGVIYFVRDVLFDLTSMLI